MSRMPNGSPSPHNLPRLQTNVSLPPRANVEDKLTQIQEYIRITSSLLNSMQNDDVSVCCLLFSLFFKYIFFKKKKFSRIEKNAKD